MLRNWKTFTKTIALTSFGLLLSLESYANSFSEVRKIASIDKSDSRIISDYLKVHKKFKKLACRPAVEPIYNKKYVAFRREGHFIPVTEAGSLDRKSIEVNIDEFGKKLNWIKKERKLVSKKSFKKTRKRLKELKKLLKEYLVHQEKYPSYKDKEAFTMKSFKLQNDLKTKFKKIVNHDLSFMTNYKFPVDHFAMRKEYDQVKYPKNEKERHLRNVIYFQRRFVEDGAQNPNHTRSDYQYRALLNTLSLNMFNKDRVLTENDRYDLDSFIQLSDRYLRKGKKYHRERLKEWFYRTRDNHTFYRSLLRDRVKIDNEFFTAKEVVDQKASSRYDLQSFVLGKQREVIDFWSKQSTLNKSLYVLETILFNEVGEVDGKQALERKDVAQIVLNRLYERKYNRPAPTDKLYLSMTRDQKKTYRNDKWLSVLFKEGEFSFTYYFIHSNVRIFCPDGTKRGRRLQKHNLKLSLNMLKKPKAEFKALRYYSRASMIGRIEMDNLWDNYRPLPQRPGNLVKRQKKLHSAYERKKYRYLSEFISPKGEHFQVVSINDRTYALNKNKKRFYEYRNPHLFKYFVPADQ